MNKIEISNPKISLTNCINTPTNPPSNIIPEITDSGVNIHLAKQAATTMSPVIKSNEITKRLPDGSTMESSHIATLQLSVLSNQYILLVIETP